MKKNKRVVHYAHAISNTQFLPVCQRHSWKWLERYDNHVTEWTEVTCKRCLRSPFNVGNPVYKVESQEILDEFIGVSGEYLCNVEITKDAIIIDTDSERPLILRIE